MISSGDLRTQDIQTFFNWHLKCHIHQYGSIMYVCIIWWIQCCRRVHSTN
jgi:hypothetical protein